MRATDIRIGNWVINAAGEIQQVICIPELYNDYNWFKPIQIDEKWGEKLNLPMTIPVLKLDDDYTVDLDFEILKPCQDTNNKWQCWVWYNNAVLLKLDYVHQIQNAFYVLTGKEIEIK